MRPEFCICSPSEDEEGAGKTGCALHPRSRRRVAKGYAAHSRTRKQVHTPASPTQWLYGLYVIVLVTGFLAPISPKKLYVRENLTTAPGRRTQTISPYA